jgi:thiamine monophosphate kinase
MAARVVLEDPTDEVAFDALQWLVRYQGVPEVKKVLAAVPASDAADFRTAAAAAGVPVAQIGTLTAGSGLQIDAPDSRPLTLDRTGWDHF